MIIFKGLASKASKESVHHLYYTYLKKAEIVTYKYLYGKYTDHYFPALKVSLYRWLRIGHIFHIWNNSLIILCYYVKVNKDQSVDY